jgi:hypothetical protein
MIAATPVVVRRGVIGTIVRLQSAPIPASFRAI